MRRITLAGATALTVILLGPTTASAHPHSSTFHCTAADRRLAVIITDLTGHPTSCAEAARLRQKGT